MWAWWLGAALASPYAFRATGEVVGVTDTTTLGVAARVPTRAMAAFTWSYDDTIADTLVGLPDAQYPVDAPHRMVLDVGDLQFSSTPIPDISVYIGDNLQVGNWDILSLWCPLITQTRGPPLGLPNQLLWRLTDVSRTALSSVALPTTPPVIADWDRSPISAQGYDGVGGLWLIEIAPRTSRRVPYLEVSPGAGVARFGASGLSPAGRVAVLTAAAPGATFLPAGPCAGAWVPLQSPVVRATLRADAAGELAFDAALPAAVSGLEVALFDWGTCTVSTGAVLP